MNTRLRVIVTVSIVLVLLGAVGIWFAVTRGERQPNGGQETGEQPKQSQPRTTAELLVGSWKLTKCDLPVALDDDFVCTYTADGRFQVVSVDPANKPQVGTGTYVLNGNILRVSVVATGVHDAASWDQVIESITEDKLVVLGPPNSRGRQPRSEYQRIARKDGDPPVPPAHKASQSGI